MPAREWVGGEGQAKVFSEPGPVRAPVSGVALGGSAE